jgi:hypothetical protein
VVAFYIRPAPPHFVQPDFKAIDPIPAVASFNQGSFPNEGYPGKVI